MMGCIRFVRMPADVTNSTWVLFRADAADADADANAAAAVAVAALLWEVSAGSSKLPRDFCQPEAYPAGTSPGDDVTLLPRPPPRTTGRQSRRERNGREGVSRPRQQGHFPFTATKKAREQLHT